MKTQTTYIDRKNITGQTFARLTVSSYAGKNKRGVHLWNCRCQCGEDTIASGIHLRSGHTRSCGCLQRENRIKHGHTWSGGATAEYSAWKNMHNRCERPSCRGYKHYGGRGIEVCERWKSFPAFLEDMGSKPGAEYSIDRIDVNGPYTKENCRWVTVETQRNNRRRHVYATIDGRRQTVMQWIRELNLHIKVIYTRINRGWTPERALLTPIIDKANLPRDRWGSFKSST